MDYTIITDTSPEGLVKQIKDLIAEGWEVAGGHQVVITKSQNRFAGSQHMDTINRIEYSQSMVKK